MLEMSWFLFFFHTYSDLWFILAKGSTVSSSLNSSLAFIVGGDFFFSPLEADYNLIILIFWTYSVLWLPVWNASLHVISKVFFFICLNLCYDFFFRCGTILSCLHLPIQNSVGFKQALFALIWVSELFCGVSDCVRDLCFSSQACPVVTDYYIFM